MNRRMHRSFPAVAALLSFALLPSCKERPPAPPAVAGGGHATESRAPTKSVSESVVPAQAPPVARPVEGAEVRAPYDLAADRDARARTAKRELGDRTVTAVVSDVFVVIGPPGWQGAAFDSSVSLFRNAMAGYMNGRFGKKPSEAISVYLFPNGPTYEAFCKKQYDAPCIAHFGFYQPRDRHMVMNAGLGLGTLTHEIVHPLVETDFPKAPTWLNEGIASVFEAPVISKPGEIHGVKNWRYPRLRRALSQAGEKDHARLDALFSMSDETFRGDREDLNYATARYVCQWLDERGKLWPFYHRWRDTVDDDPSGAKAFREVVGLTPEEAQVQWNKWLLAL